MNLGIVSNCLDQHGGAEIYLLECMRRWQEKASLTLYSTVINHDMLVEFGIDTERLTQVILPEIEGENREFDLVEDMLIRPRIWEFSLKRHDAYFLNGSPAHLVRCTPSVFMCHEPLRLLYDLRYQFAADDGAAQVHVYPEQKYRQAEVRKLEIQLELIETMDRAAEYSLMAVNSRAMGRYVSNVYDREADLVAYPGVNPVPGSSEPGLGKRAVYVGRLWHHKRIHLLIKAIAQLEEGYLDIVGQGPERENLQELAERLGVEDRVVFHGWLSTEEVAELYQNATCGAYVPLREPFGMMPLEVAAAGRPVIVAPEGGYSEILDESASIVAMPNPRAIARAMKRLFEDSELARRKGANARKCIEKTTWDRTAEDLYELLQQGVSRHGAVTDIGGRPQVGAHYYIWYDAGRPLRHWNENTEHAGVTDTPLRGPYTSYDRAIIERHLDMAEQAGLDFLTVDWEVGHQGLNPRDLEATRALFEVAKEKGCSVKLTIMLSIRTSLLEPVQEVLQLLQEFSTEAAWMRHRGRPVMWFFISADLLGCYFAHKDVLESMCASFVVLSTGAVTAPRHLPVDVQAFINGWSLYIPFRAGYPDHWEEDWALAYQHHVDDSLDPVRIFTVAPGYDDSHLTSEVRETSSQRRVKREGGQTYERMLTQAVSLDPLPEIIMITSFNEYHENTHIEPSFEYDNFYLEQTRTFTSSLRKKFASKNT